MPTNPQIETEIGRLAAGIAKGLTAAQRRATASAHVLSIGFRLVLQGHVGASTLAALRSRGILEDSRFGSRTFSEIGLAVRRIIEEQGK